MTNAIEILASLAADVTRSVNDLSTDDQASIAALKAQAAEMNPIMTISEPTEPNPVPDPDPDQEPDKNPEAA